MTPQEENELICEKLLGWSRVPFEDAGGARWRCGADNPIATRRTPDFTTWADAGLIIEAFAELEQRPDISLYGKEWFCLINSTEDDESVGHETGPAAVRATALAYLAKITLRVNQREST
jgi:hypothetical protein